MGGKNSEQKNPKNKEQKGSKTGTVSRNSKFEK